MENFKSILVLCIILGILALTGYWVFSTLESGSTHVNNQRQNELKSKNEELEKEAFALKQQLDLLKSDEALINNSNETEAPTIVNIKTPEPTKIVKAPVLKYQTLINDLQKLINGNIFMKKGSQGPSVGIIQNFLNIYNNTSNKIDNDYGASTVSLVTKFQKSQKITADGEVGPSTYRKMIDWLKTK